MFDKYAFFTSKLHFWYQNNKRNLPWRDTKSAYKIWLSEIILQQTRVAQGMAYYEKFIQHYPTVYDLAKAREQDVLKDWQGLGYYSRARNLHASAKLIVALHNGEFPNTFENIKQLKGVGDYTAAAIASFAFDLPHAVVDGNVYRVLSRFFGIDLAIDSGAGKKAFQELANLLLDKNKPALHNQAMMEFGALQCIPKNPNCEICPLVDSCFAFAENKVSKLPYKAGKTKVSKRFLNYVIIAFEDEVLLQHRDSKGIWQNLYDFPLLQSSKRLSQAELEKHAEFQKLVPAGYTLEALSTERIHLLSHQRLHVQFLELHIAKKEFAMQSNWQWISQKDFSKFPVPKLIENYVREESKLLSLTERKQ